MVNQAGYKFYIGQKVKRIDCSFRGCKKDQIYTISGFDSAERPIVCSLEGFDYSFVLSRFVPITYQRKDTRPEWF